MCCEKSRIPVFSFHDPKFIHVPEERQPLLPSKRYLNRTANLEPRRDRAFVFGAKAPENIAFKGATQGVTKIVPPPPKKATVQCPASRYKREAELKSKNKILEAARSEILAKLERTEGTAKELKEQCVCLQKENQELKQFQKCCMFVLEMCNCLSGDTLLEKEETTKEKQAEMMVLTEKLNAHLELFCRMAKEQKEHIQTAKMTWKQVEEEQVHFREKQQCFRREMEEFAAILDQDDFVTAEVETPVLTLL
ncbi:small kinetochore-associated protein [Paroedura picta]|uniref:small kinetochore-associated protein n=1 Tax=Paroedura picta TaxID=143630 RepID=UPI00405657CB